jgi:hypothetical protein
LGGRGLRVLLPLRYDLKGIGLLLLRRFGGLSLGRIRLLGKSGKGQKQQAA